jgi:nitroimidazol reductase NimA-like FMN-containing flavoprotein (pyridoxamine 5'-phosphate oxidase superfamily)
MANLLQESPASRLSPTPRTKLKRHPERGSYDPVTVYAILDEALVCHMGFVAGGQPYVLPTTYGRAGDRLFVHGSAASRALDVVGSGVPMCVTVTLLDGLVLARSAFKHSMNYRSVVMLGTATVVGERADKVEALRTIVDHVVPGRWDSVRPPTEKELKATTVLCLPLTEVSAKIRSGPPLDDAEDYGLPGWAGEIPLRLRPQAPIGDPHLPPQTRAPAGVVHYRRVGWPSTA